MSLYAPPTYVLPPLGPAAALAAQISSSVDTGAAFSHVSTVSEAIEQFAPAYRETLRPYFYHLVEIAGKLGRADRQLRIFILHKRRGTYPPFIQCISEPKLAVCKEFVEAQSEGHPGTLTGLTSAWVAYRAQLLDEAISLKEAELRHLENLLSHHAYGDGIKEICIRVVADFHKLHSGAGPKPSVAAGVEVGGAAARAVIPVPPRISGKELDKMIEVDHVQALWVATALAYRVIAITRARDFVETAKALETLGSQDTATNSPKTAEEAGKLARDRKAEERVNKQVAAEVKKLTGNNNREKGPGPQKGPAAQKGPAPQKGGAPQKGVKGNGAKPIPAKKPADGQNSTFHKVKKTRRGRKPGRH